MILSTINICSVQMALKESRDSVGKQTKPHHYVNEVRLINFAATGNCYSCYRNLPITRELTRAIRLVVCLNIKLIKLNVPYPDRKKSCRDLFLKATCVVSQK